MSSSNNFLPILATVLDQLEGKQGEEGKAGPAGPRGEKGDIGPQGPVGLTGPEGKPGKDGKAGLDGKVGPAGKDGKQGVAGPQGPIGPQGPAGESVTPELLQQVTMPIIIQNVHKAVGSKTYDASEIRGLAEFVQENSGSADTFETVSKNLDASGATLVYTGENLTSITYLNGIIKTLAYTGDNLTSVVLSGSTPAGINLTKTLSYTGDNLTGVSYT